jgi:cytochrome c oxidase subunit 3
MQQIDAHSDVRLGIQPDIHQDICHDEIGKFAMWIFLATEVLFFGGLFLCYAVYRMTYPEAFAAGSETLDAKLGTLNTAILLTSSLSMAFAVKAARDSKKLRCVISLLMTFLLGSSFLIVKLFEYREDFKKGLYPGEHLGLSNQNGLAIFYSIYYSMTGLHALHLTIGVSVIAFFAVRRLKNRATPNQIEVLGLYWHFVDLIWVFLYPLLYLIGRQGQ